MKWTLVILSLKKFIITVPFTCKYDGFTIWSAKESSIDNSDRYLITKKEWYAMLLTLCPNTLPTRFVVNALGKSDFNI